MIVDCRTFGNDILIESEVCVIGAGAAGLTLVREFLHRPFRVCLLECGGLRPDSATQALFVGENVGRPYFDLGESRQSCYGGTTAVWAGWCRPLDAIDFEARPWVPGSGWPFDRAHLDPFYRRAGPICQVGSAGYEVDRWVGEGSRPLPLAAELVQTEVFQFSAPTHFGRVYRDEIARATNIRTVLHAHAVELEVPEESDVASTVRVATLAGRSFRVSAKIFVLAAGGIENARLLLLSNRSRSAGLGNEQGLVGRYFMDHPYVNSGWHSSGARRRPGFYRVHQASAEAGTGRIMGVFTMPEEMLRREGLVNVAVFYREPYQAHAVFGSRYLQSLGSLIGALRGRSASPDLGRQLATVLRRPDQLALVGFRRLARLVVPPDRWPLRAFAEPTPNPESRISLSDERDALGRRRARLDWRLGSLELRSVARAHALLDQALRRAGLGRLEGPPMEEHGWPPSLTGGRHHIGTTRMHCDPRLGVVDAECRVHGIANLFIAGSSVFPTAGYANPTLTIVALSLRLADRLTRVLAA